MLRSKRFWQEALYWLLLLALLTAGAYLLLTNLGEAGISDCDEARHGANAYEMMQSGDYVVSTYRGETDYWNLKPPLSMYSIMLGFKTFGFNAFGMRIYSAVSMWLCMLAVSLWTKKHYGSVASLAAQSFLLACAVFYGEHFARFGDADAQLLLFYTIGILCMLSSRKNLNWLYVSALCFGLAFMSKSWHAALIPVTCFVFVCITGQIKQLKLKNYLLLLFFGLLPIAPWAIARYMRDGMAFFGPMIGKDIVARATTVHETHYGDALYYVRFLLSDPACVLAIALCLIVLVWQIIRRVKLSSDQLGVALWVLVPLILYSICVSKLRWYLFVALPALGVAFGLCCRELLSLRKWPLRLISLALCFGLMGWWGLGNWQQVSAIENHDTYQRMIIENFDRDFDEGTPVYIQYESVNNYTSKVDYRAWVQDDLLCAVLYGGLDCRDGGIDAFMEEEEHAYLIAHEVGMDWDILGECPIVSEDGLIMLIENLN